MQCKLPGILMGFMMIVLIITGCDEIVFESDTIVASSNVITMEHNLEGFNAVDVSNAFEVAIIQDDAFSVVTHVDDNIMEHLEVFVTGNTLVIRLTPMTNLSIVDGVMEAEITMPELSEIDLSGASQATIGGFGSGDRFDAELSGASRLEGDIEAGDVAFEVSGASNVTLDIVGADARIDASGSSEITLSGFGGDVTIAASGISDIDLADFPVGDADVDVSGSSTVIVNAEGTLDVSASGGSTVRYRGNPTMGNVDTSGGADVMQD